ncbi:MAG: hypothetical protein POELPBGB_00326 [Bacteroidia bacterium]|nr:hypothetical protein [Bacteroidia bacterium]
MKKKEIEAVWVLIGTDNYEILKFKFSRKKLSLEGVLQLERVEKIGYFDDELNWNLNLLHKSMEVANDEENNDELIQLMEREIRCISSKVEVPPNFILKSATPRQFGKNMVYLMLYEVDWSGEFFSVKEENL